MSSRKKKEKYYQSASKEEFGRVSKETKCMIHDKFKEILTGLDVRGDVRFPDTFSNIDRKYVHFLAHEYGLKTKSRGKEPNRYITLTKGEQYFTKDHLFLTKTSQESITRLLASYPLSENDILNVQHQTAGQCSEMSPRRSQLSEGKLRLPRTDLQRTKAFREMLPIGAKSEDIVSAIESGRVILIVGETGSGKTTQVPQIIMEFFEKYQTPCQIICSMPRRVAAVTICERVAYERGEPLGKTVGYQIRLDSRVSSQTILTYCTSGVLLRSLLGGDEWLMNVSHIIVDEVHERDKLTDFALIVLKNALYKYKNLKLILMSATIDCDKFKSYFRDSPCFGDECIVVEVPGQMYEVKEVYLEHILEGSEYMSPEMSQMKEDKDAIRFFQQNDIHDLPTQRTYATAEVRSVEEQIAMIPPEVMIEMNRLLDIALNGGTQNPEELKAQELKFLVKFMKLYDIPVDYQHPDCGRTPLMAAAIHSDIDAVDDITHMDPDLSVEDKEGKTALMHAQEAGDTDILEWFDAYKVYCKHKRNNAASAPPVAELSPATEELVQIYEKCHIKKDIDENLILHVLESIQSDGREGAVLIFLPGYDHIMCVRDIIRQHMDHLTQYGPLDIHILHSRMKSGDQKRVFDPPPPEHRKVILSTNIAETSVTINDVVFVIDCGKVKEMCYNTLNGAYSLECDWISQSCAKQRKGRAGRTNNGICFRLYSRKRFRTLQPFKMPELLRQPITELCLQAKQLAPTGTSIAQFLDNAVDPPMPGVTRNSIDHLKKMEALNENEELTKLGRHLLQIPLEPRFGKMVLYAIALRCLDPVLTIVCCLSSGEVFKLPTDPELKAKITQMRLELSQNSFSDHLIYLNAFREWEAAVKLGRERRWCQENFVNSIAMEMIAGTKEQVLGQLKLDMGLVNRNSENWAVVKAALTAGLYPQIAKMDIQKKFLSTPNEKRVMLHSSSVLKHGASMNEGMSVSVKNLASDWVLYEESHQIRILSSLRTCTIVSPVTVYLFAGPSLLPTTSVVDVVSAENPQSKSVRPVMLCTIPVGDFISFNVNSEDTDVIEDFRIKLHSLVSRSLNVLGFSLTPLVDEEILTAVVTVLETEDIPLLTVNPMKTSTNSGSAFIPQDRRGQSHQQRIGRGKQGYDHKRYPQQNWREEEHLPQWDGSVSIPQNRRGQSHEQRKQGHDHRKYSQPNWHEEAGFSQWEGNAVMPQNRRGQSHEQRNQGYDQRKYPKSNWGSVSIPQNRKGQSHEQRKQGYDHRMYSQPNWHEEAGFSQWEGSAVIPQNRRGQYDEQRNKGYGHRKYPQPNLYDEERLSQWEGSVSIPQNRRGQSHVQRKQGYDQRKYSQPNWHEEAGFSQWEGNMREGSQRGRITQAKTECSEGAEVTVSPPMEQTLNKSLDGLRIHDEKLGYPEQSTGAIPKTWVPAAKTPSSIGGASKSPLSSEKSELNSRNAISVLNEQRVLEYTCISQSGPPHCRIFEVSVKVDGREFVGQGRTKKEAKLLAAEAAFRYITQGPQMHENENKEAVYGSKNIQAKKQEGKQEKPTEKKEAVYRSKNIQKKKQEGKQEKPTEEKEWRRLRFYLIREGTLAKVKESHRSASWTVSEEFAMELEMAMKFTEHIFVIFCLKSPAAKGDLVSFQGYAKVLRSERDRRNLVLEWRITDAHTVAVSQLLSTVENVLDMGDGVEIDYWSAEHLLQIWDAEFFEKHGYRRKI